MAAAAGDQLVELAVDEGAILQQQLDARQAKGDRERAVVLRVYNYFRIVLSFLLLIVFYEVPDQAFVGRFEPRWFQSIMSFYLLFNVATGFAVLVSAGQSFKSAGAIALYTAIDIFCLTLILYTSGGVESGLGYLLVFSVAFGSVMLGGQMSALLPALATVNCITSEVYLHNTGAVLLFRNVIQEQENEERVQYLANHDDLTGRANRTNFNEILKAVIARTSRTNRSMAILIVD